MHGTPQRDGIKPELPEGYKLEVVDNNRLLKRPSGYLIAAFGEGVRTGSIRRVAETDERYLRAVERQEKFGYAADSETTLLFARDVSEARTEFLLALESAYCGKDLSANKPEAWTGADR